MVNSTITKRPSQFQFTSLHHQFAPASNSIPQTYHPILLRSCSNGNMSSIWGLINIVFINRTTGVRTITPNQLHSQGVVFGQWVSNRRTLEKGHADPARFRNSQRFVSLIIFNCGRHRPATDDDTHCYVVGWLVAHRRDNSLVHIPHHLMAHSSLSDHTCYILHPLHCTTQTAAAAAAVVSGVKSGEMHTNTLCLPRQR